MTTATAHPDAPSLAYVVKAEVLSNNLGPFREYIRGMLAEINRDLGTDEEFGQAEADAKGLKAAEDALKAAKDKALADAEALHAVLTDLDATGEEIRAVRLDLEKKITTEKERRKGELIAEAMERLNCAPRLRQPVYGRSVADATKGKRTLESMRKALDVIVTIHNATIAKSRKSIDSFVSAHGETMVLDREELETRSPEVVEIELRRRFETKKAEESRKKLEEEAARAKAEAERVKAEHAEANRPPASPAEVAKDHKHEIAAPESGQAPAITEHEEWDNFERSVLAALGSLKPLREKLIHQKNIARAQVFANALNQAWTNR
jgi:hypothetical protein